MIYPEKKIADAAELTLGGVPASWNLRRISEALVAIAPMSKQTAVAQTYGKYPPVSTYFYWLIRVKGVTHLTYTNSIAASDSITGFNESYQDMADDAVLQAKLDVANFIAEQDITEDMSKLIDSPVLAISAVYRYIATQERSMEFLVSDELMRKAIKELRVNPFLFFVYGDEAIELMPILWEDM